MKHKHNWKLSHTNKEYFSDPRTTGTGGIQEVAYLVCQCGKVLKTKVLEVKQ